jgi:tetratricopeptide (TPR) repeat protein
MREKMKKFIILFSLILFLVAFLFPQGYRGKGKIRGFVYTEDGKPIEGVKVKLFSLKAGSGFEVSTDKNGEWKALWIRGGTWHIDFEKIGYEIKKISVEVKEFEKNPDIEIKLKKIEGLILTEELKNALSEGNKLFEEGKYKEAMEVYNKILKDNPEAYIIYLNIGNCYFKMEDYQNAEENYKKVLEKDPNNINAIIGIGNSYLNRGNKEEALKWYGRVEIEKINDEIVLYNMGNSFYENSRYNEAEKCYKRAIEIKKDFLDAIYQLGLTYTALSKYQEAIQTFESYLQYDSNSDRANQVKNFIDYLKKEFKKN